MSQLNTFLKVLKKVGYPNPSVPTYAKIVNYDLEFLFNDLITEVGDKKANEFLWNAVQSLSEGDKGIKISLDEINGQGTYAYIIIHEIKIDLDESDFDALITWSWGDSHIMTINNYGEEEWKTIEETYNDIDFGDWGEFDDFIDDIKTKFSFFMYNNCGFHVWFNERI